MTKTEALEWLVSNIEKWSKAEVKPLKRNGWYVGSYPEGGFILFHTYHQSIYKRDWEYCKEKFK